MPITASEVRALANLAYLDGQDNAPLTQEINAILDFVNHLKTITTTGVIPLLHPMDLHQRMRQDTVTESDCLKELAEISPEFDEGLYCVPGVFDEEDAPL